MSDEKDPLEDIEDRLEQAKTELAKAEKDQVVVDLTARLALQEKHGAIAAVKVPRFSPGQPTRAFLKTPTASQYKRYVDMVGRALQVNNRAAVRSAQEQLAASCWVYPDTKESKDAMLAVFPGLYTPLGQAAAALAEGKQEDEGKD